MSATCPTCRGMWWVCVEHPQRPWHPGYDWTCHCGSEGMACACNPHALMPPDTLIVAEVDEPRAH